MDNSTRKVVLVGCGMVGNSFLYSAINKGIAQQYVLIDAFRQAAEGNAIDLSDAATVLENRFSIIKAGDYYDCKDADLIVITAGRPQRDKETRLDMVADNARIIQDIALQIKASGFKGVTLIASNPVDVLASVYQKVTGFAKNKVISSGTTLDSARLRRLVGNKLNIPPDRVNAYVLGEHGDSSVSVWSKASIMQKSIAYFVAEGKLTEKDLKDMHQQMIKMAYKIIALKKSTFYGIGACLSLIAKAILNDEKLTFLVGAKCEGEYNVTGTHIGVPAIIGINGIEEIIEWKLTKEEQDKFEKSEAQLHETLTVALLALK
ncbi:L-lactate dehydrogenase [Spiroplasma endosymbiont of Polydrusus formosus]|uniref:L-lactate dehydrogenase n=1 Tax=Spiroplasma endosymbiont of Polydrusus formosus TaxID=3139326 RepID=UPI0035B4FFC7